MILSHIDCALFNIDCIRSIESLIDCTAVNVIQCATDDTRCMYIACRFTKLHHRAHVQYQLEDDHTFPIFGEEFYEFNDYVL